MPKFALPLIAFLLLTASSVQGQPYSFINFSLREGFPQSKVWAGISDHRGYLWFGTQGGGLIRYDGQSFQTYDGQQGVASDYVHCLYEDQRFRLWVGTSRGICYRERDKFIQVPGGKTQINCLTTLPDGQLIAGTPSGMLAYDQAQDTLIAWQSGNVNPLEGLEIYCFLPVDNEVLIGTNEGLFRYTARGRILAVSRIPRQEIYALDLDPEAETCWLGIYREGLVKLSLPGLLPMDTISLPEVQRVRDLLVDDEGQIWTGTADRGIVLLSADGKRLGTYGEQDGLVHNDIRSLLYDSEGQLWLTSAGGGVARCLPSGFRQFNNRDGLLGDQVDAVHQLRNGNLLLSIPRRGVQQFDSTGRFSNLLEGTESILSNIKSIAADTSNRIYLGTEREGLAILDSIKLGKITRREGLASNNVLQVEVAPNGEIWVATVADGLTRVRWLPDSTYRIRSFGKRQGLPDLRLSSLHIDSSSQVWFGTQNGHLGRIGVNRRQVVVFGEEAGLPPTEISAITMDTFGRVWVAAKEYGIYWLRPTDSEPFFRPYANNPKLPSRIINLLQATDEHLWVGTETGVDRIAFLPEDGTLTEPQHFGRAEGFLGVETSHGAVTPPDKNGRIWFGTVNGLMAYQPGQSTREVPPPRLHFQEIALFYRPIRETQYAAFATMDGLLPGMELPHLENHLSFSFRAVDLTYPSRVRYRFRLNTNEPSAWSPPSRSSEVSFAGLAPGPYTFEVQATNNGEVWSVPKSASFYITAPFWRKAWFQQVVAIGIPIILILFTWWLVRRVKKREAKRRQVLETENQLLQLEQKALQLQMNPHFIFNALTSIRGLVGTNDPTRVKTEISNFATLMRGILNNSRRESITLAEEIQVLDQYLRVEQFCQAKPFQYQISVAEELDPEETELPPMLLQPFVENAVVHGVAHLSRPGEITIHFSLAQKLLSVSIQDNGIGREAAAQLKRSKRPGHQSVALSVTKERLQALKNEQRYRPLIIRDLKDVEGNIAGTEVLVKLPVERWE